MKRFQNCIIFWDFIQKINQSIGFLEIVSIRFLLLCLHKKIPIQRMMNYSSTWKLAFPIYQKHEKFILWIIAIWWWRRTITWGLKYCSWKTLFSINFIGFWIMMDLRRKRRPSGWSLKTSRIILHTQQFKRN